MEWRGRRTPVVSFQSQAEPLRCQRLLQLVVPSDVLVACSESYRFSFCVLRHSLGPPSYVRVECIKYCCLRPTAVSVPGLLIRSNYQDSFRSATGNNALGHKMTFLFGLGLRLNTNHIMLAQIV